MKLYSPKDEEMAHHQSSVYGDSDPKPKRGPQQGADWDVALATIKAAHPSRITIAPPTSATDGTPNADLTQRDVLVLARYQVDVE